MEPIFTIKLYFHQRASENIFVFDVKEDDMSKVMRSELSQFLFRSLIQDIPWDAIENDPKIIPQRLRTVQGFMACPFTFKSRLTEVTGFKDAIISNDIGEQITFNQAMENIYLNAIEEITQ